MNSNSLSYMVSNFDLVKKIHSPIKIIEYPELAEYSDITQLLPNAFSIVVILLETQRNTGHWTCLIRSDNTLMYFDSYGKGPDKEFKLIGKAALEQLNERPYLSALLTRAKKQGFSIENNKTALQSKDPSMDTCGKHVVAFANAVVDGLDLKQYIQELKSTKAKTKLSYDDIVNDLYALF